MGIIKILLNLFRWWYLGLVTFLTIIPRYLIYGVNYLVGKKPNKQLKSDGKAITPIIVLCITNGPYLICICIFSRWYVQKLKLDFLIKKHKFKY